MQLYSESNVNEMSRNSTRNINEDDNQERIDRKTGRINTL